MIDSSLINHYYTVIFKPISQTINQKLNLN